jgi:stage II sporulation protein D
MYWGGEGAWRWRAASAVRLVGVVGIVSGFPGIPGVLPGFGAPAAARAARLELPTDSIRVLVGDSAASVEVDGRKQTRPGRFRGPGPHEVDGRRYRGAVELLRGPAGLRIVNELLLEDYVAGTVLGEISEQWGDVVLRAQAIAARTYALHRRAHPRSTDFDLRATTADQVYLGIDGETPAVRAAVDATRGQVLTYAGVPILAAYHSAAGGRTASAEEVWGRPLPYLASVDVPGEEDSPDTYWRTRISSGALGGALAAVGFEVGRVRDVAILARSTSGRVRTLRVRGSDGEVELSADALRGALGARRLRSTLFELRRSGADFVFVGSGNGHGVGMSQWGARALALRGAGHRAILAHFYPGTRLEHVPARVAIPGDVATFAAHSSPLDGVFP